jgi:uncharacterized membrane protein
MTIRHHALAQGVLAFQGRGSATSLDRRVRLIPQYLREKAMRMIMGITALVLVWVFSMAGDVWAFSLENIAAVVQINACLDCEEVEQQNLAFIFQDINTNNVFMYMPALTTPGKTFLNKMAKGDINTTELSMNLHKSKMFLMSLFSVSGDGNVQALPLENIAAVVQINACQDCTEVEQQNLAFIFQDISTNNVFMYMPALTAPDETFLNKMANLASVVQDNFCIECREVTQQNIVLVIQEIDINDTLMSPNVSHTLQEIRQNSISNIVDVTQTNECIMCEAVNQINVLFILQDIGPGDLFNSTSEGMIPGSLFMDLLNIAASAKAPPSHSVPTVCPSTGGKHRCVRLE